MKKNNSTSITARFTNRLALKAQIGFTGTRQLRIAIGAISQVDPFDETISMEGFLPISVINNFIESDNAEETKGRGKDIEKIVEEIMSSNYIKYPTEIKHNGKYLNAYRVFFDRFEAEKRNGIKGYYFRLHDDMRPDLQGLLGDYVTFKLSKKVRSGASIRFALMVTAFHNKQKKYKEVSILKISVQEFRRILSLENKYKSFDNLKRRVIVRVLDEINELGFLNISCEYVRTGRYITGLIFYIKDGSLALPEEIKNTRVILPSTKQQKNIDYVPSTEDVSKLTKAELAAYQYLVERKCKPGIVYKRILTTIPSSEFAGWEDVYIKRAWHHFEQRTKYKQAARKAGAFVKWWQGDEFKNNLFSVIMEEVIAIKKSKNEEQRANRKVAKNMTASAFHTWYISRME